MSKELVPEETKTEEGKLNEEKVKGKAKDPEYRTYRVKASDYVFITKTDLRYRYVAFLLAGILGGAFIGGIYQAVLFPSNYNPPSNGNGNGNGNNTTTLPILATFTLVPFEEPAVLFKVGYDIRDTNYYIRFVVNIQEVRGHAGTCKLQCTVWTDTNHWFTADGRPLYESYGGLFEKSMSANEFAENVEILFDITFTLYEADGLDWSSATVEVVY